MDRARGARRCCRRSARSTRAPPASSRCRRRPTAPLDDGPGLLGGELKPFQRAGVSYLLAQRRAFLADEQGLGKTIEALAALEADDAYPAIVVCPASLKLNWLREISQLAAAPQRARARRARAATARCEPADVTIVNYDIVAARLGELSRARAPRARARRVPLLQERRREAHPGRAAARAPRVPQDGLVLALTGTPVMNRPPELISQLRILGRLADFGSGAQFGRRFRGADAHLRLHWHLRARCFARRLKADVLPQLPAKTRAVVPVELDNEAEYRLAEHDVIAWLRSQPLDLRELDARVAAALRAERLVRLNALKLLAARGKLHCGARLDPRLPLLRRARWSCSPATARSSARCSSASPTRCTSSGEDSHRRARRVAARLPGARRRGATS